MQRQQVRTGTGWALSTAPGPRAAALQSGPGPGAVRDSDFSCHTCLPPQGGALRILCPFTFSLEQKVERKPEHKARGDSNPGNLALGLQPLCVTCVHFRAVTAKCQRLRRPKLVLLGSGGRAGAGCGQPGLSEAQRLCKCRWEVPHVHPLCGTCVPVPTSYRTLVM